MRCVRRVVMTAGVMGVSVVLAGCLSSNAGRGAANGAAVGGATAVVASSVTQLILDGEIDGDRLVESTVAGAVGGATTGAINGRRKDKQNKKAAETKAAPSDEKQIVAKIGQDNYQALTDLIYYRLEAAYKRTLKSTRSKDAGIREAGFMIQALIDKDRGNSDGVQSSLAEFVKLDGKVKNVSQAEKELGRLYQKLNDQRKVKGISKP